MKLYKLYLKEEIKYNIIDVVIIKGGADMFDSHVHSKFSADSNESIVNIINNTKGAGVTITDHMDINASPNFIFNADEYYQEYIKYRNDKLLLGIEIGLTKENEKENKEISKAIPYDFILGSIHFINGYDLYYPDVYEYYKREELYSLYLDTILYSINNNPYIDSLAHIDYISRYSRYDEKEIKYNEFKDIIDRILLSLIDNNILLELNTRRINQKEVYSNLRDIFKRYKALGGRYVTIGSDAHKSNLIGSNFSIAEDMTEDSGLISCHFKNRKIIY